MIPKRTSQINGITRFYLLHKLISFPRTIQWLIFLVLLLTLIIFGSRYFPFKLVDFSVYWSAGSLLFDGGNPYNPQEILPKQQMTGASGSISTMLQYWYPPWTLPISMLAGTINYEISQFIWFLLSITALAFSSAKLCQLYQGGQRARWVVWLLSFSFTPFVYGIFFGQISPIILLAVTGFLLLIPNKSSRTDFLAGFLLGFLAIKPTLLYLFWPALLLWGLRDRRLLVLGGLITAIMGGTLISMIFRPSILCDYLYFLQTVSVTNWKVPTIGFWLRAIWGQDLVIYQFAPLVFGMIWLLIYYWRRRAEWHWLQQISWISLASLTTTPFAWSHDQVILIPALIEAVVLYNKHIRTTSTKILMLTAWIILNVLLFLTHLSHDDSWFVWQTPLFLLFYAAVKIFIRPVQADKPEKAN